jgi:hypothetical protein
MNEEDGSGRSALTTNTAVDTDPDWGGAGLP